MIKNHPSNQVATNIIKFEVNVMSYVALPDIVAFCVPCFANC